VAHPLRVPARRSVRCSVGLSEQPMTARFSVRRRKWSGESLLEEVKTLAVGLLRSVERDAGLVSSGA
jgi:hypothetical protein